MSGQAKLAAGIRDPTKPAQPQKSIVPPDHPCYGCIILNSESGVPYCFLPRCDREIFKPKGE